jgi:hypothetical protein
MRLLISDPAVFSTELASCFSPEFNTPKKRKSISKMRCRADETPGKLHSRVRVILLAQVVLDSLKIGADTGSYIPKFGLIADHCFECRRAVV